MTTDYNPSTVWDRLCLTCLVLIIALGMSVYYQGLSGPFLLDDYVSIAPLQINNTGFGALKDTILSNTTGPLGRPLTIATFVLNKYYSEPGSAYAFKLTNLLLHFICAILVFQFLKTVFLQTTRNNTEENLLPVNVIALMCTAAWTLHPLQVSTVLYVVQRMAILSTLFSLLAIVTYVRLRASQSTFQRQLIAGVCVCLFIVLSVLSKENGILVIPVIGLIELCIFKFMRADGSVLRIFRVAFFVSAGVTLLALTAISHYIWDDVMAGYASREHGLLERLSSQPRALLLYLEMIVNPDLSKMSLYHDGFSVPRSFDGRVLAETSLILFLAMSALASMKRYPIFSLGVGFFFILHSIESTVLPLEPVFEHRNYLALLGIIMPVFWYGGLLLKKRTAFPPAVLLALVAITYLSSLTFARTHAWSDFDTIITQAVANKPQSIRARNVYTSHLEITESSEQVLKQTRINQADLPGYSHFILYELMFNGIVNGLDPSILERARLSLSEQPVRSDDVVALFELLRHAEKTGFSWLGMEEIASLYQSAIGNTVKRLKPAVESTLLENYSSTLQALYRYDEALKAADESIALNETAVQPRLIRAFTLAFQNQFGQSQAELNTVIELDKNKLYSDNIRVLQSLIDSISQAENLQ
ncbi:MAG: hypothetical protein AB8B87_08630 [Granulosicoccus sp.]